MVRKIFGLPRNAPAAVVIAVSVLNPIVATLSRDRERLVEQTLNPLYPDTSIARAVLRATDEDSSGRSNAVANLAARWKAKRALIRDQLGIKLPNSPSPHRVAVEVALFGDRVGQQSWRHDARVAAGIRDPCLPARALRRNAQPIPELALYVPRATAAAHAADIYFQFSQPLNIAVEMHGRPPLSLHGPSGTSLVALCNLPCAAVSTVARLQTGDLALQRHPWRARSCTRPHEEVRGASGTGVAGDDHEFSDPDDSSSDDSNSEPDESDDGETVQNCHSATDSDSAPNEFNASELTEDDTVQQAARPNQRRLPTARADTDRSRFMSLERQCRLCKSGLEHPYHFFFECPAGRLPALRQALLLDAPLQYWRVLAAIQEASLSEDGLEIDDLPDIGEAIKTAFADANKAQAHWLTHRLLWAMPWSARSVPPSANAAYALGELFDITVHSRHALRPMVDSWVGWAVKWTRRFGDEWASQLRDVPLAVPVPVAASSASPPTQ